MQITLKTLHKATAQQVFDQVATHLLKQGRRSKFVDSPCLYRGPYNLQCAAGCLIADDEYDESFEDKNWETLLNERRIPDNHFSLIKNLQRIHDHISVEQWDAGLESVAIECGLNTEVLNTKVLEVKIED